MRTLSTPPALFVEPFAGGGIVSLTVAFERLAERVLMVELDHDVAAVWHVILRGDGDWLCNRIVNFELSPDSARRELEANAKTSEEIAFKTLLRNRVNHGGILAPGSGLIKNGEKGKGIGSRWYPETLARRIKAISMVSDRIDFVHGDGLEVLQSIQTREDTAIFIDPPYSAGGKRAGTRLYLHHELDHTALFAHAARLRGAVLMTYDFAEEVQSLARDNGFECAQIAMKNTHHAEMNELLIGRNLNWVWGPTT